MKFRKVLFVSAVYPWPVDDGKKVVLQGLLSYFAERLGSSNVEWVYFGGKREGIPTGTHRVRVFCVPAPGLIRKSISVALRSFITRRLSIQESIFVSPRAKRDLMRHVNLVRPDLIIYDTVRMSSYMGDYSGASKVLYLDDLFSVRYQLMLAYIEQGNTFGGALLGKFRSHVPPVLGRLIDTFSFVQKLLLKHESAQLRKREVAVSHNALRSILLNPAEAELLRERGGANVEVIRPLLLTSGAGLPRTPSGSPTFLLLGAWAIPHNRAGLEFFLSAVAPLALNQDPGIRFQVIGAGAEHCAAECPLEVRGGVDFLGYVPDLDALFASCTALIVPLQFGTGIKLKTLEALARGVPLITTRFGIEGIPVQSGRECLLVESATDYLAAMGRLAKPAINDAMSQAARAFFEDYYSKSAVFSQYDRVFGNVPTPRI